MITMSPKPSAITETAFWRVISVLHREYGAFSVPAVADLLGERRERVTRYVSYLLAEQVVRFASATPGGRGSASRYALIAEGAAPPMPANRVTGGAKQRAIWTALRHMKRGRAQEIAEAASTDIVAITVSYCRSYLQGLARAGIVRCDGDAYQLVAAHNSGPRAPIVIDDGAFDLNRLALVLAPQSLGRAA